MACSVQQRQGGKTPAETAVTAAQTRLRPILMTSIAFIAGLLPLVFASGAGAASRHSLGTAVVGGMLVSTAVSLVVVPAMYLIIDEIGARISHFGRRSKSEAQRPAVEENVRTSPRRKPGRRRITYPPASTGRANPSA